MIDYLVKQHWDAVASILGLLVSIVGFIYTIYTVKGAKQAVLDVRRDISRIDLIADLTTAMSAMEEIKRLQRKAEWESLPDRYSALQKSLISIQGTHPGLTEDQKGYMQVGIAYLADIEAKVERYLMGKKAPPDISKVNPMVSNHMNKLHEVLIDIKAQIGK